MGEGQNGVIDQPVMHYNIRGGDQPSGFYRQQIGIARACSDQIDYAFFHAAKMRLGQAKAKSGYIGGGIGRL